MSLSEFNKMVAIEYPEWANAYSPFISGKSIRCNAVLNKDDGPIVIAIFKQTRQGVCVYFKLKDGTYLYGDGSGSFIQTDAADFTSNIVKA